MEETKEVETNKELVTEVTSIAKEEERTGQKIKMPSAEEMVQRASLSLIRNLQQLKILMPKLSGRGRVRATLAGLQLPVDGVPVSLKKEEEQLVFALIQRTISDRFIILQHHISQELKKEKEKKFAEAKEKTEEAIKKETTKEDSNDK